MIETGGGRTKGWESLECLLSGAIADLFVTIALITADCSADGGMVGPLELETSLRQSFHSHRKSPMAFFWLKVLTTAFTFKTLLRHYAKWC